jgi:hypothetical protein
MRILLLLLVCLRLEAQLTVTLRFCEGKTVVDATAADNPEAVAALETAVAKLDRPYRFALPAGEPEPQDELTRRVRTFTGDWDAFADLFMSWTAADPLRKPADQVLSALESGLYAPLQTLHYSTPLLFEDFPGDGTVTFAVAAPVDPDTIDIALPGVPDAKKREQRVRQLRRWLEPLRGQSWLADRIKSRLLEFYERLNLAPVFELDARVASVRIIESQRIATIVFPDGADHDAVRRALYLLVADREFRKYQDREPPIVFDAADRAYWSAAQFQVQQLMLAQAGLRVQAESAGGDALALVVRTFPAAPQKYEISAGFDYRAEQGLRLIGVSHRGGLSAKVAASGAAPSGELSWFGDFLAFPRLGRRMSFELRLASQRQANRFLAGRSVEERRTGAMARMEFELFRDRAVNGLRLFAESHADYVSLGGERHALQVLDLGTMWSYHSRESEYPWRARVEGRTRVAFPSAKVAVSAHRELPSWFAADFRGRFEWAGSATPWFELPSLGGPESVRGVRVDEAVGHRLWSMQPEFWAPLPITSGWARRVKLATFADAGAAYSAVQSVAGLRFAPGFGVRIIFHPVVLQLDSSTRGKFYFNVITTLPF